MVRYIAKEGERLDVIIYAYYGSLTAFEEVLGKNIHLANKVELNLGDIVYLPNIKQTPINNGISLW